MFSRGGETTLRQLVTDVALCMVSWVFAVYLKVAGALLRLLMPLTKRLVTERLESYGLKVNGDRPFDPQVKNDSLYIRSALEGDAGMYESYVDEEWTSEDVAKTFEICMDSRRTKDILHPLSWTLEWFNLQRGGRAWAVGKDHYDIGNDIYESMLDPNMQYTCGYWERATDLTSAQLDKMDLIASKLKIQPGMKILDIGCGFGSLAKHLATKYGAVVTGCSISKEQTKYGEQLCKGLSVNFLVCDYRDLVNLITKAEEKFDRIVSVGMFEHVGLHNYEEYFKVVDHCLKPDGLFLLHTIGNNHKSMPCVSMWLHWNIFPNSRVPYYKDVTDGIESLFIIEDWQNFGHDYSKTLKCWRDNFISAWNCPEGKLKGMYGQRFYRIWILYLSLAQAAFLSRSMQLWQIVLSKDGIRGGYRTKRLFN